MRVLERLGAGKSEAKLRVREQQPQAVVVIGHAGHCRQREPAPPSPWWGSAAPRKGEPPDEGVHGFRVLLESHYTARRKGPGRTSIMNFTLDCEQEEDGRWIAEVLDLPGVLVYGANRDEAILKAEALALRVIAERLETQEAKPASIHIALPAAA